MLVRILILATLMAAFTAPAVRADDCPDTRATDQPGHVEESKKSASCGIGLRLFGFDIDVLGVRCPKWKKFYPDRQVCKAEKLLGHRCTYQGPLDVIRVTCDCKSATILFDTGLALPGCDCDFAGTAGTVEDFQTQACE